MAVIMNGLQERAFPNKSGFLVSRADIPPYFYTGKHLFLVVGIGWAIANARYTVTTKIFIYPFTPKMQRL